MEKRKIVNLSEYSPEILNFFRTNNYKKTKEGLSNAISDWLDGEYYMISDKKSKLDFVEKYSQDF